MNYRVFCDEVDPVLVVDIAHTPAFSKPVVFLTDGSGQGRFSGACRVLSETFERQGFGTCALSLSTGSSPENGFKRYSPENIGVVWKRVCTFLRQTGDLSAAKFCIAAWGDGAAVALHAASAAPAEFTALAINGRTAEALNVASKISIPTLFVAGSEDNISPQATKAAYAAARGPKEFSVIEGAGASLREPGSLEELAERSARWFVIHC